MKRINNTLYLKYLQPSGESHSRLPEEDPKVFLFPLYISNLRYNLLCCRLFRGFEYDAFLPRVFRYFPLPLLFLIHFDTFLNCLFDLSVSFIPFWGCFPAFPGRVSLLFNLFIYFFIHG